MWSSGCAIVLLCDPGQASHPLWIVFLSSAMRQRLIPFPPNLRKSKIHRHENSTRKWLSLKCYSNAESVISVVTPNNDRTPDTWLLALGPDKPSYLGWRLGPQLPASAGLLSSRWASPWWALQAGAGSGDEPQPSTRRLRRLRLEAERHLGGAEGWGSLGAEQRPSGLQACGPATLLPQPEERLESLPPSPQPRGRGLTCPAALPRLSASCWPPGGLALPWAPPFLQPPAGWCCLGSEGSLSLLAGNSSPGGLEGLGPEPGCGEPDPSSQDQAHSPWSRSRSGWAGG